MPGRDAGRKGGSIRVDSLGGPQRARGESTSWTPWVPCRSPGVSAAPLPLRHRGSDVAAPPEDAARQRDASISRLKAKHLGSVQTSAPLTSPTTARLMPTRGGGSFPGRGEGGAWKEPGSCLSRPQKTPQNDPLGQGLGALAP